MRIGVVLEDNKGLEGNVCAHFGQCAYFLLADIDEKSKKIIKTEIAPNNAQHGGGGCMAVDEILKHNITHVIAGGMGMNAQLKFQQADVRIFGSSGNVQDAINSLLQDSLGGIDACREHGDCH